MQALLYLLALSLNILRKTSKNTDHHPSTIGFLNFIKIFPSMQVIIHSTTSTKTHLLLITTKANVMILLKEFDCFCSYYQYFYVFTNLIQPCLRTKLQTQTDIYFFLFPTFFFDEYIMVFVFICILIMIDSCFLLLVLCFFVENQKQAVIIDSNLLSFAFDPIPFNIQFNSFYFIANTSIFHLYSASNYHTSLEISLRFI